MSVNFPYDVFLSYNHEDKARVRKLAERLKTEGIRVWWDEWVIQAGDLISLKVDEGLEQSRVLLLCISEAALASGWVAMERSTAIHRDPSNEGRRFIPLLLSECDLPNTLRRYKYLDLRVETDASFEELLRSCVQEPKSETANPRATVRKKTIKKNGEGIGQKSEIEHIAVLEHVLVGHSNSVTSVAISPDGKWVCSGSKDESVKIWKMGTGKCAKTLTGHSDHVTCVSFSHSGILISGSRDSTIQSWNPVIGEHIKNFDGNGVTSFVVTEEGKQVISSCIGKNGAYNILNIYGQKVYEGSQSNSVEQWEIHSHKRLWRGEVRDPIQFVGCSEAAGYLVLGCGNEIEILALKSHMHLMTLRSHTGRVNSVQITSDGRFAISGSDDKTIKVWDLRSGSCAFSLEGHKDRVHSIALSPNGRFVASTGFNDFTVRLWDYKSGTCIQIIDLKGLGAPVTVAFSPDGLKLIVGTASSPFNIYLYHINEGHAGQAVEATRRYVNAKVVLIGEGTVGKTSLANRLIKDEFVICARTHGMNVWPLDLPLQPDSTIEREALLWDLAGQEDSRLIHQLFLEETSLALLLINSQNPDPFSEAGDWLKALETAANNLEAKRQAVQLLIFSQLDVGGMKVGKAKIDRFCRLQGFSDWLETGAESGKNCSDRENGGQPSKLKQLIAASIPWDRLPWTSTPRLLAELKNAVMAMRDESDIRLLRYSELAQRLEQALPHEKFSEADLRTAVTLLANHGLARPLKFGDLVLLRPDLINGYAGAVIRAARAHADEIGSVLEADIYNIDFDFTGVERLKNRADEDLLLRALVQTFLDHSLCIAEETPHGRHLVFPSQYRREKDIPHDPDVFVSYTFGGEWQTVWTTLVVRLWYSQEFVHRELWRNAAEFESARKHTLGLKITKTSDGSATISLYFDLKVPDELKVIFIEYVHRHLAKYACEVKRDRHYVCPECGKLVKDLDAVFRRLEAGKDFITCQVCDEKVPFVDFIEQRLKSDPVARKILAMDEIATRELDTQALEQILIGHMMAIAGEANQIYRPVTMFDHGIDGEVEFRDNDGNASGRRIYVQLKNGNSYLRLRKRDGNEIFDVKEERHLEYWVSQPVDVYLVVRQTDDLSGQQVIRWMNVTRYLNAREDKNSRQIVFTGEKLDMESIWKVRDGFFPTTSRVSLS